MRKYIAKLAAMHTANLKMDTVRRFNQRIAEYFEVYDIDMSKLQQELCVAREAAADEFERKEKGKCVCTSVRG
jgi:hypothetical protein